MGPTAATGLSVADFQKTFQDEGSCAVYLFRLRWIDGFVCLNCHGNRAALLKSRAFTYDCLNCGRQTSITADTVMHRSRLPLQTWFSAAHLIATHPGGVSARQIQERLGIPYQTAWTLKKKLELPKIGAEDEPLQGHVEI